MKTAVAIMAACLSLPAYSAQWVEVNDTMSVDKESIRIVDEFVLFWGKINDKSRTIRVRYAINCEMRMYTYDKLRVDRGDKTIHIKDISSSDLKVDRIEPDSVMDVMHDILCR